MDVNDPGWWKRFTILLRGMERKNNKEIALAGLQYSSALLANGSLTEDSFNKTQERARNLMYSVIGQINPWEGASYEERVNKEAADYKRQWMKATGEDPDSPEYKAREAALLAHIRRSRTEETEEQKQEKISREAYEVRERKKKELVRKRLTRGRRSVWTRR